MGCKYQLIKGEINASLFVPAQSFMPIRDVKGRRKLERGSCFACGLFLRFHVLFSPHCSLEGKIWEKEDQQGQIINWS